MSIISILVYIANAVYNEYSLSLGISYHGWRTIINASNTMSYWEKSETVDTATTQLIATIQRERGSQPTHLTWSKGSKSAAVNASSLHSRLSPSPVPGLAFEVVPSSCGPMSGFKYSAAPKPPNAKDELLMASRYNLELLVVAVIVLPEAAVVPVVVAALWL